MHPPHFSSSQPGYLKPTSPTTILVCFVILNHPSLSYPAQATNPHYLAVITYLNTSTSRPHPTPSSCPIVPRPNLSPSIPCHMSQLSYCPNQKLCSTSAPRSPCSPSLNPPQKPSPTLSCLRPTRSIAPIPRGTQSPSR